MELKLPARFEDLKLKHLMVLHSVSDPSERLAQMTGHTVEELITLPVAVLDRASSHCEEIMAAEVGVHPKRVSVGGKTMGFIPDWSAFTTGEWIDMERYSQDIWTHAPSIMAMLYRPITDELGDSYAIETYTSKEDSDIWMDCPAQWFVGALLFFSSSRRRLLSSMRRSLETATEALIESVKSGDGTTSSITLRDRTSYAWTGLPKRLYKSLSSTSRTYKTFTT